jgi:hypothetical protein
MGHKGSWLFDDRATCQRFLVYYCNTLIREIDPATRRSAIIDRYVATPPPRP